MDHLSSEFLVIILQLFNIPQICLKRLVDFYLYEFFQTLISFHSQLNIGFLRNQKLMSAQFFLVELQLLLESWELVNHLLLGVFELFDQLAALGLCLL